jgi:hypothetical protein
LITEAIDDWEEELVSETGWLKPGIFVEAQEEKGGFGAVRNGV